jgi:hypothetical protein
VPAEPVSSEVAAICRDRQGAQAHLAAQGSGRFHLVQE